ncbi:hypothetical protein [Pseudomonas aeruginosa]|uniref:hypothetical protein n=1 Tax=Pseudomonas aeruginosa TaxID=287 RepID=UPI00070F4299|nr:hypothetical protein [Pseudomonas aeruginosa]
MTNFQTWLDSADIPAQQNGQWIDLETGIAYDPSYDYASNTRRASLSPRGIDARAVAKAFGGRALTGTARQKEWAEKIRAEKVQQMNQDQAEMACDPSGLLTAAKFWIENRNASAQEIAGFVMQQKALLAQHRSAQAARQADKVAKIAAEYNALTARWGF